MENGIQVSIIIVNYNTKELLHDCIQSIQNITQGVTYEIIVVDNDSSDDSVEMLQRDFPLVKIIVSDKNLGFGKANNLGIEMAQGEFILFLNTDILLMNNAIQILYNFISQHEEVGICGACLYNKELKPNLSEFSPSTLWDAFAILLPKCLQKNNQNYGRYHEQNHPREVPCIIGADMMVRKKALDKAGKFDSDFFMYAEEVELTHRIKKNGYKIFLVPEAHIIHFGGMSTKENMLNHQIVSEKLFSGYLYYQKVYGELTVPYVHFCLKLKYILSHTIFSITHNEEKLSYWEQKYLLIENSYKRFKSFKHH